MSLASKHFGSSWNTLVFRDFQVEILCLELAAEGQNAWKSACSGGTQLGSKKENSARKDMSDPVFLG